MVREKIIIILWFAQQMHGEGEDNNYTIVRPGTQSSYCEQLFFNKREAHLITYKSEQNWEFHYGLY